MVAGCELRLRINAGKSLSPISHKNDSTMSFAASFAAFRESFVQRRVALPSLQPGDVDDVTFTYTDAPGAATTLPVVVVLSGLSSDHQTFFRMQLWLLNHGVRCLALSLPLCASHAHFVALLRAFFEQIGLGATPICLMGHMLGSYLAQLYAARFPAHVVGLVLCSAFCSTKHFQRHPPLAGLAGWAPEFLLKRKLLSALPADELECADDVAAVDFLVGAIEGLSRDAILSRMQLMTASDDDADVAVALERRRIAVVVAEPGTLTRALPQAVLDKFAGCRECRIKSATEFYFITAPFDQLAMHVLVHLRSLVAGDTAGDAVADLS